MLTQQLLKVTAIGGEWVLWLLIGMSFLSIGFRCLVQALVDRLCCHKRPELDIG